ncbi:MAG: hypothetical protein ACFYJB_01410 [Candidatus Karelsulcia muelleri]
MNTARNNVEEKLSNNGEGLNIGGVNCGIVEKEMENLKIGNVKKQVKSVETVKEYNEVTGQMEVNFKWKYTKDNEINIVENVNNNNCTDVTSDEN